jgi:hypothetical protein
VFLPLPHWILGPPAHSGEGGHGYSSEKDILSSKYTTAGSGWLGIWVAGGKLVTISITFCLLLSQFSNGPLPGELPCQGCMALGQLVVLVEL